LTIRYAEQRFTHHFACTDAFSETKRNRSLMRTTTSDAAEAALARAR
jgi:hypothetical protein